MKNNAAILRTIRIIQHFLAAFVAFAVAISVVGTSIVIQGMKGDYSYNLYESDRGRKYEQSYLFNNILGNNVSDIMRFVAVRSQLESDGNYYDRKKIDVTAYVNRGATLTSDYVTAVYYLSDLLKWAQSGFKYETRDFTEAESAKFLSRSTTYTHLKDNRFSGGMNPYLSSQIEGNSVQFAISGNSTASDGTHTYLLNRYQTVDGKNIEDLVSSWEEYNLLCSYVEEAAGDLLANYEEYGKGLDYYSYLNSNLRYYVTRTINGKTEIYTNVDELTGETTGVDIGELFKDYGKYIYYCPYELSYDTNTLIKESVLRQIVKTYSYAYPDQMKVYIAVDTMNYHAIDSFTQGKANFTKYMPHRILLYILAVIAAFVYIVLMGIYVRKLRPVPVYVPVRQPDGSYIPQERFITAQHSEGKLLHTETIFFFGCLLMAIPFVGLAVYGFVTGSARGITRSGAFPFIAAVCAFIFSIGFLSLIYRLTRKINNQSLYNDSFLKIVIGGTKNAIINTTDNANVIVRSWVPYVLFVVLNFLLFKLGIAGILVAAALDILVGVYLYRQNLDRDKIIHVIENIMNGDVKAKADTEGLHSDNIELANAVNSIGEGIDKAVDTSMKDEKLKADLITNVSHDIKTPLTSIINYVDLIKREDIDNDRVREYIQVLDVKSQKLKQLTEDLVEASKISSGNISIQLGVINFVELVNQTIGEFYEKLEKASLQTIFKPDRQEMMIEADPRHLWRVVENLLNNVCKYALSGTRVYMDMHTAMDERTGEMVVFSIKNISASELNIDASELTERFIRGDVSRTTEGSGLGLSIAKNLTTAMGGTFDIRLDGDLFKVVLTFNAV